MNALIEENFEKITDKLHTCIGVEVASGHAAQL